MQTTARGACGVVMAFTVVSVSLAASTATWSGEDLPTATPEIQGISFAKLAVIQDRMEAKKTRAFLVVRHDQIVHEWYAPGVTAATKQGTASLAKALVGGLSLAVAMTDGDISLDDPAAKFVPQWKDDPRKSRITIRHLGSHTSGLSDSTGDAGLPGHCGMGWWSNAGGRYASLPKDAVWGAGAGDQLLLVVPSLDLIMVRNGEALIPGPGEPPVRDDDVFTKYHDYRARILFEPLADAVTKSPGESSAAHQAGAFPRPTDLPVQTNLPDPLVMFDGRKVTSPEMWRNERRPELIRLFQHYMFGQLPPKPATVTGKVERVDEAAFGGKATLSEVTLRVGPPEVPSIHLMLVVPNQRPKPAPVVLAINYFGNHTLVHDKNIRLADTWMPERGQGVVGNRATEASRGTWSEIWRIQDLIDRGYALATFYNGDIDPDTPDQRSVQKFTADPADDCGSIGAWAWGLQRAVDYLVTAPGIDSRRIVVTGHSRMGKAALLAAAIDERIALAIPHQAGCGGSAPSRARIAIGKSYDTLDTPRTKPPETVANINDQFPHWFNARFKEFNNQPERLPFDQHCLVALCAPRPVLFTNGRADTWINPAGQFEVLRAAAPVYRLLGAGDFTAEELPPDGQCIDGVLGYYLRPGGHSLLREDWKVFLDFADKRLGRP